MKFSDTIFEGIRDFIVKGNMCWNKSFCVLNEAERQNKRGKRAKIAISTRTIYRKDFWVLFFIFLLIIS
jgi:hypothetical protein